MRLNPFRKSTPAKILAERYHLLGKIGTNGARQTFVAQDLRVPGHPRCIIQQFDLWADAGRVEDIRLLFESQSQALAALGIYDFVPELLNHFQQEGQFYWVQTFVEGEKLSQELISLTSWSDERVIVFLSELLNALSVIHQQGSLHLDLKPSNLIRRYEDNRLTLVNFGTMQQLGAQIIKPLPSIRIPPLFSISSYMPSEQIAGYPKPASDIYAVGIMAVQALTGHPVATVLENIQARDLYRNSFASLRHPALLALLERMVQYDYRDRYTTVAEVLADIKRLPPELSQHVQVLASPSSSLSHVTDRPANASPESAVAPEPLPQTLPMPVVSNVEGTAAVKGTAMSHRVASSFKEQSELSSGKNVLAKKALLPVGVGVAAIALFGMSNLIWRVTNIDAAIRSVNGNSRDDVSQERQLLSSAFEGESTEGEPTAEEQDVAGQDVAGQKSSSESDNISLEDAESPERLALEESFITPTTPASRPLQQEVASLSSASSSVVTDAPYVGGSSAEPLSTQAAKATVDRFYDYVAQRAWNPARSLLNDKMARSLEPDFFYQFEDVSVENVRVTNQTTDAIDLMVQNTYVYPDGSYQQENRNYTVELVGERPIITDTDFVEVIRDRR